MLIGEIPDHKRQEASDEQYKTYEFKNSFTQWGEY